MSVAPLQITDERFHLSWRVRAFYRQLEYSRLGWGWEFLRRNSLYQEEFSVTGLNKIAPTDLFEETPLWPLLQMESPQLDAKEAKVFWRPEACPAVLPLAIAGNPVDPHACVFAAQDLRCDISVIEEVDVQHVLFSQDGRSLQLIVHGGDIFQGVVLASTATLSTHHSTTRMTALKRFNDLVATRELRPQLYPPDKRARRLAMILQALDGALAGAHHREIAAVIFGEDRVSREWNASDHLRDQVRRAISQGRALSRNGYLRFLL